MATETKIARVAFMDRGVYSAETEYSKWDFVTTEDSTYLYIGETSATGKPVTDTAYWKCIADGKQATAAAVQADTARTELTTAVNTKMGEADDKIEEMDTTISTYDGRVSQVESDIDQLADELDAKANHGYDSSPKTLKEVDEAKVDKSSIVGETGQGETSVMHQKAVTDELGTKASHGYESNPKTLKEVDDDLVQLESEVSLFKKESNLKDAIQDSKIKDIESIISTMNPNQSAQLSVSGRKVVSLPKNASSGGMQVKMEGLTAENLVMNGDFANGETGWTRYAAMSIPTFTQYADYINIEFSSKTTRSGLYRNVDTVIGNKYYCRFVFRGISNEALWTYNPNSTSTATGSWQTVSRLVTADAETLEIGFRFIDQTGLSSQSIDVRGFTTINLTETFGSGNEPTKEQCDLIFSDYFEGVKSFEPTGRVRSVGKNLFDSGYWKNISNYPTPFGGGYRNGSLRLKPNTTYTFRVTLKGSEKPINYFQVSGGDGTRWSISSPATTYPSVRSFTTGSDGILTLSTSHSQSGLTSQLETTNFMLVEGEIAAPYEPYKETNLYLTAPELRSNGTVKDEIRKGANGYELVKRVGVGTLGDEMILNGGFDTDTGWSNPTGGFTIEGGVATYDGSVTGAARLNTTTSTSIVANKWYRISFDIIGGAMDCGLLTTGGGLLFGNSEARAVRNPGRYILYLKASTTHKGIQFYALNTSITNSSLDNFSVKEITGAEPIASTVTELSDGTIIYTLATPEIIPISYGGVLNSAENGTVYHEPVVADAGVYDTKMDILLTDYPIATIVEIIKHENGIDTYLNVASAVIASDGLSFTHPDLADGDLVLFTYAFDKESTNGNITATFYDSNVVKIDTVTGKAYKIEDVVTDGVLTRILTEV